MVPALLVEPHLSRGISLHRTHPVCTVWATYHNSDTFHKTAKAVDRVTRRGQPDVRTDGGSREVRRPFIGRPMEPQIDRDRPACGLAHLQAAPARATFLSMSLYPHTVSTFSGQIVSDTEVIPSVVTRYALYRGQPSRKGTERILLFTRTRLKRGRFARASSPSAPPACFYNPSAKRAHAFMALWMGGLDQSRAAMDHRFIIIMYKVTK